MLQVGFSCIFEKKLFVVLYSLIQTLFQLILNKHKIRTRNCNFVKKRIQQGFFCNYIQIFKNNFISQNTSDDGCFFKIDSFFLVFSIKLLDTFLSVNWKYVFRMRLQYSNLYSPSHQKSTYAS